MTCNRTLLATVMLVASVLADVPGASGSFVTRAGTALVLDGRRYRFTGLDIYNANSNGLCWYAMASGPILDDSLTAIGGTGEVFRAWFFQPLAIVGGQRDWASVGLIDPAKHPFASSCWSGFGMALHPIRSFIQCTECSRYLTIGERQ